MSGPTVACAGRGEYSHLPSRSVLSPDALEAHTQTAHRPCGLFVCALTPTRLSPAALRLACPVGGSCDGPHAAVPATPSLRYRKSAEGGEAAAQLSLGLCYKTGEGVPKDAAEAVRWCVPCHAYASLLARASSEAYAADPPEHVCPWPVNVLRYRQAAEQNHMAAAFNLAYCLERGEGTAKSPQEALKW